MGKAAFKRQGATSLGLGSDAAVVDAPGRLTILAGLIATVWVLYMVLYRFVFEAADLFGQVMSLVAVTGSIGAIALSRRWREHPDYVVRLGLAYEVFVCGVVAVTEYCKPDVIDYIPSGVSWNCVLIIAFPFVVPATPRRTLIAGSLAALMTLVAGLTGMHWAGAGFAEPPVLIALFLPPFLCAAIAYVPARLITRMGEEVTRARRMGSYQLIERIGAGGMGEVWRAEHALLARPAAVKFIRPDIDPNNRDSYERALRRFEREARATAALESPHTVALYDYGVSDDGTFYYVMELLNGIDLNGLVAEFGPVPPERAVFLLRQICHSLGDAHGRGLYHRDIKPGNVIVGRRAGQYDYARVVDFGLVTGERLQDKGDLRVTREAEITGTPAFIAPEMATGELPVDARTDLYCLGCVAYWLLTGALVFDDESPMKVAINHVTVEPAPPSARLGRELPAALEALVLRCLAKKPAARPQSAAELDRELAATGLEELWTQERAAAWWDEHAAARVASSPLASNPSQTLSSATGS